MAELMGKTQAAKPLPISDAQAAANVDMDLLSKVQLASQVKPEGLGHYHTTVSLTVLKMAFSHLNWTHL